MCPISQLRFLTTRGLSHIQHLFQQDRPTPQPTVTVLSQRQRITTLLFTAVKAFFCHRDSKGRNTNLINLFQWLIITHNHYNIKRCHFIMRHMQTTTSHRSKCRSTHPKTYPKIRVIFLTRNKLWAFTINRGQSFSCALTGLRHPVIEPFHFLASLPLIPNKWTSSAATKPTPHRHSQRGEGELSFPDFN